MKLLFLLLNLMLNCELFIIIITISLIIIITVYLICFQNVVLLSRLLELSVDG